MQNPHSEEAKAKYGRAVVEDSEQRVANWSPEYKKSIMAEAEAIYHGLAALIATPPESEPVQRIIAQHHTHVCRFFDCTVEHYQGLGQAYVTDQRFVAYYEKYAPGLAQFIEQAITVYCDRKLHD